MNGKPVHKLFKGAVLFFISIALLIPLFIIVVTALKHPAEFVKNPVGPPSALYFANFSNALTKGKILQYGLNSVFVAAAALVSIVVLDTACAYGLVKTLHKLMGKAVYMMIMSGMMIGMVGYVTMILVYRSFGLHNSLWGVVVAMAAGSVPLSVFLLVGFIRAVPREIVEAAEIDGCSDSRALVQIILPLIAPAISTVVILNLVTCWNNLLTPLLLLKDTKKFTIPLGLLSLRSSYRTEYTVLFAGLIISAIPIILTYVVFQKQFVESLAGSLKG